MTSAAPPEPLPSPSRPGVPAWAVAWGATLLAAAGSASAMGLASLGALKGALDASLAQELRVQAGLAAAAVAPLPLEAVVALDGDRSRAELAGRLGALAAGAELHGLAVLAPGVELTAGPRWVARGVDQDLIAAAERGDATIGTQYRATDGAWYRTGYAPIPGHPGWVVGVEGSDATLAVVDRPERRLWLAAGGSLSVAAVLAGVVAAATSRPLRRLDRDLAAATPTDPTTIAIHGPREVRRLARSARALLGSIHARDLALREAHADRMRQLETLAAAVAHEVRNPLNALGMTLERLAGADAAKRETLLGRARDRHDEIAGIVERFLSLSKPISPAAHDFDPVEVVREAADETPELAVDLPPRSIDVHADPLLVRQIVRNLLRNAREAGAGAVRVAIVDGPTVALELEDDGPGLSEHADPFAWFATTRATGTGLGLPWSRRLAQAMGGELTMVSRRPARFRIALPPRSPS